MLNDPKVLQTKANQIMRKSAKYSTNPFMNDEEEGDEIGENGHREKMEEGGFTMVVAENEQGTKGRGTDGVNTVQGVSQEEAKEYFEKQMIKMNGEGNADDEGIKYLTNKEKNAMVKNDFYKFQLKDVKKQKLEELRKGFEEDRKRLSKLLQKRQAKDKKLLN